MTELKLLADGGGFFEGPRWHDGAWYVSDFYRHVVLRIAPDGETEVVVEIPGQPSGLGWLPDGSMVIASMKDHRLLRWDGSRLSQLADLRALCGGILNDLVVDRHGHTFVGNFGYDLMAGGAPQAAKLIRVDPDGAVHVAAEDLYFPNGSVITPDGSTLIVGETMGNRYSAWDLADDGTLSNRRDWATFGALPGLSSVEEVLGALVVGPDGCTMDAEEHIWAADALGSRCVRVAPGGQIVATIPSPAGLGTFACQLGGEDGRTLLLCCAPDYFEHARAHAREARLYTTRVEVPHAGLP